MKGPACEIRPVFEDVLGNSVRQVDHDVASYLAIGRADLFETAQAGTDSR